MKEYNKPIIEEKCILNNYKISSLSDWQEKSPGVEYENAITSYNLYS